MQIYDFFLEFRVRNSDFGSFFSNFGCGGTPRETEIWRCRREFKHKLPRHLKG